MLHDAAAFSSFYDSPLGHTARRLIRRQLRMLVPHDVSRQHILAYGYAEPYQKIFPQAQLDFLPHRDAGSSVIISPLAEGRVDAPDGTFDRVFLIHALEYAAAPHLLIGEMRRVLADHGRLIVIVPSRHGFWAHAESTPFGHGVPYSPSQLRRLLHEEHFTLEDTRRALFSPPINRPSFHHMASGLEKGLGWLLPGLAGVLIGSARKNFYAPSGLLLAGRHQEIPKGFAPVPACYQGLPNKR